VRARRLRRRALLVLLFVLGPAPLAKAEDAVRLFAAGSLRPALTDLARSFTAATGLAVEAQFGASGLLRERLEKGEPGEVFASADLGNPRALQAKGLAGPVVR
jgi:molybdate transport system substrate-binding protein